MTIPLNLKFEMGGESYYFYNCVRGYRLDMVDFNNSYEIENCCWLMMTKC